MYNNVKKNHVSVYIKGKTISLIKISCSELLIMIYDSMQYGFPVDTFDLYRTYPILRESQPLFFQRFECAGRDQLSLLTSVNALSNTSSRIRVRVSCTCQSKGQNDIDVPV